MLYNNDGATSDDPKLMEMHETKDAPRLVRATKDDPPMLGFGRKLKKGDEVTIVGTIHNHLGFCVAVPDECAFYEYSCFELVYKFSYGSLSRITKKYWTSHGVDGIPCALSSDGLLFMFHVDDVASRLAKYPFRGGAWWFSDKFDRRIAERFDAASDLVTVNPQFVYENFASWKVTAT